MWNPNSEYDIQMTEAVFGSRNGPGLTRKPILYFPAYPPTRHRIVLDNLANNSTK